MDWPTQHLARKSVGKAKEKHEQACEGNVRADGGHKVPAGKGLRVVGDPARHAGEPKEVHGEEGNIRTDQHQPEV
jgi:hypothetical protein